MAQPAPLDIPLARKPDREVAAAVLTSWDGRYLLQLRDDKPTIHMPGHWALFGGSLEPGEPPAAGMARELEEELGFRARIVTPLAGLALNTEPVDRLWRMHFFAVPFTEAEFAAMVQTEGAGKGLFTAAEVQGLAKIAPWDLMAVMLHAHGAALFPNLGTLKAG
ncbi:MAG TPA: NUDIX domain-containing protein [Aliidongia sp.]|nr:NUDIX domain-containing protein [Aliidongia sp.]